MPYREENMPQPKPAPGNVFREYVHVRALNWRIEGLEKQIREEMKRPAPDFLRLSELKRQKLFLKDKARRFVKARPPQPGALFGQQRIMKGDVGND